MAQQRAEAREYNGSEAIFRANFVCLARSSMQSASKLLADRQHDSCCQRGARNLEEIHQAHRDSAVENARETCEEQAAPGQSVVLTARARMRRRPAALLASMRRTAEGVASRCDQNNDKCRRREQSTRFCTVEMRERVL